MDAMGYKPSYADPDVCIKTEVNPNGYEYYEYILCCVGDVLCISDDPGESMIRIQENFNLKYDNISEPVLYLGATLSNMLLEGNNSCWTISTEHYVKAEVTNVEECLDINGRMLPPKCVTPLSRKYPPRLV